MNRLVALLGDEAGDHAYLLGQSTACLPRTLNNRLARRRGCQSFRLAGGALAAESWELRAIELARAWRVGSYRAIELARAV
jgi:hypothetical protein